MGTLFAARDLGRLHEIVSVLIGHGLGDIVRRLDMVHFLQRAGRAIHWRGAEGLGKEPEVRVREALEELGPTFVKVGQVLAGRVDLLSPPWTDELSRLHQHVPEADRAEVREQLIADLGAPPEEVFREFDPVPLAAASIAQVHRASLEDGTPVVLKVRRPGIEVSVAADLRLLARIAELVEEKIPELRRYRPKSLVRELRRSLRSELDLRIEAQNAARLRSNLSENTDIVIPRMYPHWSRESLCVMDYLSGPSVGEWIQAGKPGPTEASRMAVLGAKTVLKSVFIDGCFHADPHPGNLILLEEGRLGLVDFGMVGFLTESRRFEFLGLLLAIATRNVDEVVGILLGWSGGDVDVDQLSMDCALFIDRYNGVALRHLDVSELLGELTAILRENDLFMPSDVALLLKVFVTLESVGRQLDPEFVMAQHIEPFARLVARERSSPVAIARRGAKEIASLLATLPKDLRQFALMVRRGRIRVDVDLERLDRFGQKLDRSASRLTIGLVTSALIVGTAISLTVPGGPRIAGLPLFGFLAFTSSIVAGVWLLGSIFRSGRS